MGWGGHPTHLTVDAAVPVEITTGEDLLGFLKVLRLSHLDPLRVETVPDPLCEVIHLQTKELGLGLGLGLG